tara:strand:+ start:807 stop:1205 length:399 start_codon:yes stop_codon:yes gene_type:complete
MKPDVSNMTLEVIEAIKNEETVVFEYGKQELRNIKPEGFFGDYDGFQGTDIQLNQFRRFKFSEVTDWIGVKPTVMKEFTITVPCTIHYKVVANNKKEAIHIFLANPLDIKGIVDIEETANEEFEIINEVELD